LVAPNAPEGASIEPDEHGPLSGMDAFALYGQEDLVDSKRGHPGSVPHPAAVG